MARKQSMKGYWCERGLRHGGEPAERRLDQDALADAHGVMKLGGGT